DFDCMWGRSKSLEGKQKPGDKVVKNGFINASGEIEIWNATIWPQVASIAKVSPRASGFDPKFLKWIISTECLDSVQRTCAVGECPFSNYEEVNSIFSSYVIPLSVTADKLDHDKVNKRIRFGVSAVRCEAYEKDMNTGWPEPLVTVGKDRNIKLISLPINVDVQVIVNSDPKDKG